MLGILNIDKPKGWSSFDVIRFLKRLFNEKKAGHLGTLDPLASGVLPVFLGKGTRLIPYFNETDKIYRAHIHLGIRTDTFDAEGKILEEKKVDLKKLSERGVSIFFKQLFDDNFFHADMHPGNIFVSAENPDEPTYVAVDYAICGSLSEKEQLLIGKMLADMFSRNYSGVAKTMINAGWVSSLTKPIELEVTIRTAIDPIFEKPFSEINFGEMLLFLFEETRTY